MRLSLSLARPTGTIWSTGKVRLKKVTRIVSLSAILSLIFFLSPSFAVEPSIRLVSPAAAPQVTIPDEAVYSGRAVSSKPMDPSVLGDLLQQGKSLELEDRWGEALAHYEKAMRAHPEVDSLRRRFDYCRINFDLRRRYRDSSFQRSLDSLTENRSLQIYDEILHKIQSHHVDSPHWKELLEHGLNHLDAALATPAFLEKNLVGVEPERINQWRHAVRRSIGSRVVQNRQQTGELVRWVADYGKQHLGLPQVATIMEFCCGAVNSLDPYSAFLTPDQLADVYSQIEGNFVGLGIELKMDGGRLTIVRVITGSPAEAAGVRRFDQIVAVDGKSVLNMTTDEAASLLQGEAGSTVRLTLVAAGQEPREIAARRRRVEVPSINQAKIVDPDQGIAYLHLSCFQKTTSRDLDEALWRLHQQGMRKGLIIDLRGNPGGLLLTAVEVADRFVEGGVIVSTRGRDSGEGFHYTARQSGTWHVPLIILIDQESASAAEILAGAIRDHHRGTLIGDRSYGKGSVQGIFPLAEGGAGMRLTTAKFYSPEGRPFSLVGVEPDIQVHRTARPIDGQVPSSNNGSAQDPVLAAALQFARQQNNVQRPVATQR